MQDKKEQKTGHELATLIKAKLGREVIVSVNEHPVYGWQPTVYARNPTETHDCQLLAERIAKELRSKYYLKD
jgi:hypothetical protein